jgi:predicted DNA-binding protein YlxM (UPF0122 family)
MNKQERAEILNEMRHLYFEKDWTLDQLAAHYNVTKQAVFDKFNRNGIKLQRKKRKPIKTVDRERLSELYEKENLPLLEVAARLGVSYRTVIKELKRHGIKARWRGELQRKYPAMNKLKIGEKIIAPRPSVQQPHSSFYYLARVAEIKISVKTLDNETLQITRIE